MGARPQDFYEHYSGGSAMNSNLEIDLPNELLAYKENIEATIKPFIKITAKPEDHLRLWQSKFGGVPYFPKGLQYPVDSKGQAMFLLAQINFSETPPLNSFPETGILQFYISGGSDLYGACFESPARQDDFKVLYFPEVAEAEEQLVKDFGFLSKPEISPIGKQSSLAFSLEHAPIPAVDYQFEPGILNLNPKSKYEIYDAYQKVYEEYEKLFRSEGHKIGGYPYFTQNDPREFDTYKGENHILLFQMDSDHEAGIMWGDCGVANFFISEQDLANKDFSRVLYNWDCC
jgi:uncharacterized protein YwqG